MPQSFNSLCIPLKFLTILRLDFYNGMREDGLQDDESRLCEDGLQDDESRLDFYNGMREDGLQDDESR